MLDDPSARPCLLVPRIFHETRRAGSDGAEVSAYYLAKKRALFIHTSAWRFVEELDDTVRCDDRWLVLVNAADEAAAIRRAVRTADEWFGVAAKAVDGAVEAALRAARSSPA